MRGSMAGAMLCLTFCLVCQDCGRGSPPAETPQSRWIVEHADPVRTIDPTDESFDDLERLARRIGDATIVLLGEQSHGEGSTFLAKTRLVEFLHQRMGFDVLAMESGLYSCERAGDEILAGVGADSSVSASVFDVWTGSEQFQPLIEYLDRAVKTPRPLELTGFDMQLTGSLSRDRLAGELRSALDAGTRFESLLETISTMTSSMAGFRKIPEEERNRFYLAADEADRLLASKAGADPAFLRQVLQSTKVNARFFWTADFDKPDPTVMNLRDEQMAANLLWLARERYKGRKIVVWAATSHVSRNRQKIRPPIADQGMIPMGHHLWQAMPGSVYVVAFTSATGRFGSWRGTPADLAFPRQGSLEYHLASTPYDYLFLDLRSNAGPGSWLSGEVLARPMGHYPMVAVWPEILDAVFFIRKIEPSRSRN